MSPATVSNVERSVLIVAFATFVALFARISPRYPSTKQRSWILTALASSVMSLASLPFLLDFVKGGKVSSLVERRWLSESACRFFQVYLFSDLSIGSLYYRDRINLLTGWVHHIVYIILMQVLLSWQWTHLFLLAAIMELPTFILSISYLFPQTRNDIFFAAVFFITRIAFHIVVIIQLLNPGIRRATVNGSFWAPALYIVALPMHVHWFIGCVRGILKRSKEAPADNSPSPVHSALPPAIDTSISASQASWANTSVWTKPYPPSTQSLPTRTSNGHRFRKALVEIRFEPVFNRPIQPERPQSFVDADDEEAIGRLVQLVHTALESRPARVSIIVVRKAVEMGKGVRNLYRELRGYGADAGDGLMKASQEVWAF